MPEEWNTNLNQFEKNMSVIAKVDMDNIGTVTPNMVLGAFVNDECRGFIKPTMNPQNKMYLFFINVMSNLSQGETVRFKLYDNTMNVFYDAKETIPYQVDNIIGSINEPYMLTLNNVTGVHEMLHGNEFSLNAFPVPFDNFTLINYKLTNNAHVVISVYNVLGEKITTILDNNQEKGSWQIDWRGTDARGNKIAAGIYTIEMKAGNAKRIIKVVKTN